MKEGRAGRLNDRRDTSVRLGPGGRTVIPYAPPYDAFPPFLITPMRRHRDDEDAEGEEPPEFVDQWALKERLLTFMRPGETVLRALKRLGPSGGKEGGGEGLKRGGKAMVQKRVDVRTPEEKEAFEQVTELADQLLRAGAVEVYDVAYEAMRAGLEGGDEGRRGGRKRPAVGMSRDGGEVLWEYKGPDGLVHGPYSSETIRAWRAQGFFTGPTAVEMRRVGSGTGATMQVGEPSRKKVTFSVATLAADLEDDEEGGGQGGREAGAREGEWVGSDAIDWSAQT